jgi:hypothetical protein
MNSFLLWTLWTEHRGVQSRQVSLQFYQLLKLENSLLCLFVTHQLLKQERSSLNWDILLTWLSLRWLSRAPPNQFPPSSTECCTANCGRKLERRVRNYSSYAKTGICICWLKIKSQSDCMMLDADVVQEQHICCLFLPWTLDIWHLYSLAVVLATVYNPGSRTTPQRCNGRHPQFLYTAAVWRRLMRVGISYVPFVRHP